MAGRFIVKHVAVPGTGWCVEDTFALPVRFHAGGQLFNRYERRQPHSAYYSTPLEALDVARWLTERAAGYPVNLLLCDPTTEPLFHDAYYWGGE